MSTQSPNPWADAPAKFDLDLSSRVQALSLDDPTDVPDALDAPSAWADLQGRPPPPRPESGQSIRGHSRSTTHDLSCRPPSRPSSPSPQPSLSSPAFPSFAAIARSLSIPSVVRPRTRPLSMDSAKPIPPPSPATVDFAAQQQSPLSKSLPLQPDATPSTRSATPPTAIDSLTPRMDKDPQFDFQTFLDQMKSRSAEPVAKYLKSQVLLPSFPVPLTNIARPVFSAIFPREHSPSTIKSRSSTIS